MSWMHALRERVAGLLMGRTRDRGLEEEIAYHLELETNRQIAAGCDPAVARARALARFGNPRHVTDATRDERGPQLLEGGMQDLQWALRSLRKSPGFTALALVTLVLGIGAATLAFSVLDTVLLRPLAYDNAERLVFIQEKTPKRALRPASYPNFADWRDKTQHVRSSRGGAVPIRHHNVAQRRPRDGSDSHPTHGRFAPILLDAWRAVVGGARIHR